MHSHSRRQLILESGCSHQVAVFPLCQCPLFLHLFLLLQLCMASRQTGQKFFWFIFWLQASLHHQLLNVLISLFKLSQAAQAKQKNACLLAGDCQVFASPVYYIVRWSKSMLYDSNGTWHHRQCFGCQREGFKNAHCTMTSKLREKSKETTDISHFRAALSP